VIALIFGIAGFALRNAGIPLIPIIIGLVLGPAFTDNPHQSLSIANGDLQVLLHSPITLLLAIAAAVATTLTWQNAKTRQTMHKDTNRKHKGKYGVYSAA